MKLYVFTQGGTGLRRFFRSTDELVTADEVLLGEVELDVKPVKKWVKKEEVPLTTSRNTWGDEIKWVVPPLARNIKITYEVEE